MVVVAETKSASAAFSMGRSSRTPDGCVSWLGSPHMSAQGGPVKDTVPHFGHSGPPSGDRAGRPRQIGAQNIRGTRLGNGPITTDPTQANALVAHRTARRLRA